MAPETSALGPGAGGGGLQRDGYLRTQPGIPGALQTVTQFPNGELQTRRFKATTAERRAETPQQGPVGRAHPLRRSQ